MENTTNCELSENNDNKNCENGDESLKKNSWEIDDREELFFNYRLKRKNKPDQHHSKYWVSFGKILGL